MKSVFTVVLNVRWRCHFRFRCYASAAASLLVLPWHFLLFFSCVTFISVFFCLYTFLLQFLLSYLCASFSFSPFSLCLSLSLARFTTFTTTLTIFVFLLEHPYPALAAWPSLCGCTKVLSLSIPSSGCIHGIMNHFCCCTYSNSMCVSQSRFGLL